MATNYIAPTWRMPENTNKDKLSNYSLAFDGNSNYINFTETEFLKDSKGSFSFWIKPGTYSASNYGYFFSGSSSATGGIAYSEGSSSGSYYPGVLYWYNGSGSIILDVVVTENVWNHIVVVFDGTSLKTYKDGSLGTTKTITAATTLAFNTIGRNTPNTNHYLKGDLSEITAFDYDLSAPQVTYLYNLNNPMAITGTKPIAYYPLGDNSNPRALAGYPNLAVGGSVFNFIPNNYINAGTGLGNSLGTYTGDASISLWFKADITTGNDGLFSMTNFTGNQNFGNLRINISGNVLYFVSSALVGYKYISFTDTTSWHHLVCIFKSGDITNSKIYLDGINQTTTDFGTFPSSLSMTGKKTIIGGYYGPSNTFDGELSNVSFFNTGLENPDVQTLYNNGTPGDISSLNPTAWWKLNAQDTFDGFNWTIKDYAGSNDGASVGMNSANLVQSNLYSTTPYSNYSIKFNGSTQYFGDGDLNGGVFNGATSLSISQWMTIDPNETTSIGAGNWEGVGKYQYLTRWRSASGGFDFYIRVSGVSTFARFTTTITPGDWYHVVGTWDGSNTRIYVNGVAGTPMTTTGTLDVSTGENLIGKYLNSRADGLMSNVAYWYNKELTQQEVLEVYNNGVATNLNNFSGGAPTRWYPMDGKSTYFNGSTLTARDVINNVDMLGYNITQASIEGNAPGSNTNGTGNNLDISNLKGNMSNSINNSYSINMADYGDPNNQGVTPANSGRTTDVPGSVDPGGQFSPFNTSTTPRSFEGDACIDNNDGQFYTQEFPPQPVIPFVGTIVYTDAAGTGYPEQGYYSQYIDEYNIKVYYLIGANGEVTDSNMCI